MCGQPQVVFRDGTHIAGVPQVAAIILTATRLVNVLSAEELSVAAQDEVRVLSLRLAALQRELALLDLLQRAAAEPPALADAVRRASSVPIF
jgi:hypothetical protein